MGGAADRYRRLVEHLPASIAFLYEDRDELRYTFVGGEGLEDLGMTKADLEGSPVAENRPPEIRDRIRSYYRQALDGESVTFEVEAEGRHYRFRVIPVDDDGAADRGAGIAQDVTERAVYEAELERQNERLEGLVEMVSHDLRNPLNVARGRLDLLAEECDSEHVAAIEDALERMESIIDEVLAGDQSLDRESLDAVDLGAVAEAAWQNVATADAELRVEGDLTLRADGGDLRRLFENCYRNAVEHTGDGVTVRVGALEDGFYVEDDGPGIPEEERDAVFERGYSTEGGTGLGLFIVRRVAEAHGWEIAITEGEAGGARFEITGVDPA